jgi:hypothetical protein
MKREDLLWKEIDDAVVSGFVNQLDAVAFDLPTQMYGTRIWFNGRVSIKQCEKIAEYIRSTYDVRVDQQLPFCITIWHPKDDQ